MKTWKLELTTAGERFYLLTEEVKAGLAEFFTQHPGCNGDGILVLSCLHTSCALTIGEAYEESATVDMENFLKHIAPRNLDYITHKTEGPDDSPSHMKSILLAPSLTLLVEDKKILMGGWQGIFLAEFRDAPRKRSIVLKYRPD